RFWLAALDGYNYPGSPPDQPVGSPPSGFDSWEAWADAEGIPAEQRYAGRTIIDTTGRRPDIHFLAVPEDKSVKNRVHLDLRASTGATESDAAAAREAEAERLIDAGAALLRRDPGHLVLTDPEGN